MIQGTGIAFERTRVISITLDDILPFGGQQSQLFSFFFLMVQPDNRGEE